MGVTLVNSISKFKSLRENSWTGLWAKRILSELEYLLEVSKANEGKKRNLLDDVIGQLWNFVQENGAITKEIVLELEEKLLPMQSDAKKYTVLLVGHAHIDMNWMWGYQESAAVTVDTFETILQLMDEYPEFKFSQSQASVYAILEEYYPELLEKVKARIKEGRWEVTASTWVENDKNMSGSESNARHILYTKNYLAKLLEINADSICLDFEPDTFGHNENMPEILNQGGVKYYYHCRGYDKEHIYRWKAPSGAEVLTYREPVWYNARVMFDALSYVPSFCKEYGLNTALKMYGVGDHGGGPTRKDLEHWLEMQTWPFMPVIKFSFLREFFAELEKIREKLPVVQQELNYVFTGCYTSQARLKKANKYGEDRLFEAEALDVMAHNAAASHKTPADFATAWRKILFNQFHDILPGSGTIETREFGMGEFQRALAGTQINTTHAMRTLCAQIDTEELISDDGTNNLADYAFGGGAGFGGHERECFVTGSVGRAGGKRRIMNIFNPTQYNRKEVVTVTLWDWDGDASRLRAYDVDGNVVKCQVVGQGLEYWDHYYHKVAIEAEVDAFGYNTYILDEEDAEELKIVWRELSGSGKGDPTMNDPRVDYFSDAPIVLENGKVRAQFAAGTMKMISLYDKISEKEYLSEPAAYFREIIEDTRYGMTSWRVGSYASVCDVNESAAIRIESVEKGLLEQKIVYRIEKEKYTIRVKVILETEKDVLDYQMEIDWHMLGNEKDGIPQLNFIVPLGYKADKYACTVPFGVISREATAHDVPCLGFMGGIPVDGSLKGLAIMSDCKYGFRGNENSVAVTLIRSSYNPDRVPDAGKHLVNVGVGLCEMDAVSIHEKYDCYIHPIYSCANTMHTGSLAKKGSFLQIEGDAKVTALKVSEDKKDMILRVYSLSDQTQQVALQLNKNIQEAYFADVLERKKEQLSVKDNQIKFTLPGRAVRTIRVN